MSWKGGNYLNRTILNVLAPEFQADIYKKKHPINGFHILRKKKLF